MRKYVTIRTTDRAAFKRCRRQWSFSSSLKHNLQLMEPKSYFWFGHGGHFAMEDFHGYNKYKHPCKAFDAFVAAYRKAAAIKRNGLIIPADWKEQVDLGHAILEYYLIWLNGRPNYETYWVKGKPLVEVRAQLQIPPELLSPRIREAIGDITVLYDFTFDRVVKLKEHDRKGLWVLDYKFFKTIETTKLDYDTQMESYIWGANTFFELPLRGAILEQHRKTAPDEPRLLASGKLSTDVSQSTTSRMYKDALIRQYSDIHKAPAANVNCLNELTKQEGEEFDRFIRRDYIVKTPEQIANCGRKILMELEDMLNPDLPLYPNMTKDCSWDCSFCDVCQLMDRDDDWESLLRSITVPRQEERDIWRKYL